MTTSEIDDLKKTIDNLPEDMTLEQFGKELLIGSRAMKVFETGPENDMTHEDFAKEVASWQ